MAPPLHARRHLFRLPEMLACILMSLASMPAAAYRVEIEAPKPLQDLLEQFLDLARYEDREDLTREHLDFMLARMPDQVARLAATEGFFSTDTKVGVRQENGETLIRVTVTAGPRTTVSNVRVDVEGPASERSPKQVEEVQNTWPLTEGEPFRQEEWAAAKQRGLQILQRRRYAAAEIASSEARVDADRHVADLSMTYQLLDRLWRIGNLPRYRTSPPSASATDTAIVSLCTSSPTYYGSAPVVAKPQA